MRINKKVKITKNYKDKQVEFVDKIEESKLVYSVRKLGVNLPFRDRNGKMFVYLPNGSIKRVTPKKPNKKGKSGARARGTNHPPSD